VSFITNFLGYWIERKGNSPSDDGTLRLPPRRVQLLVKKELGQAIKVRESFLLALLAYQGKKDIVFRFIIEYSSFKGFWPLGNNNRPIFLYEDFERWYCGLC
jgi:hypothetical protein